MSFVPANTVATLELKVTTDPGVGELECAVCKRCGRIVARWDSWWKYSARDDWLANINFQLNEHLRTSPKCAVLKLKSRQ